MKTKEKSIEQDMQIGKDPEPDKSISNVLSEIRRSATKVEIEFYSVLEGYLSLTGFGVKKTGTVIGMGIYILFKVGPGQNQSHPSSFNCARDLRIVIRKTDKWGQGTEDTNERPAHVIIVASKPVPPHGFEQFHKDEFEVTRDQCLFKEIENRILDLIVGVKREMAALSLSRHISHSILVTFH